MVNWVKHYKAQPASDLGFDQGAAPALRVIIPGVFEPASADDCLPHVAHIEPVTTGQLLGGPVTDDELRDPQRHSEDCSADVPANSRAARLRLWINALVHNARRYPRKVPATGFPVPRGSLRRGAPLGTAAEFAQAVISLAMFPPMTLALSCSLSFVRSSSTSMYLTGSARPSGCG
jgi:hypothetical protein